MPLSTRPGLSEEEIISVRHLRHYLGNHDKFLIAPEGFPVAIEGFDVKRFPGKFFGSVAAHNLMLQAPAFYRAFEDYEYLFFYHLDSLVLSDRLLEWCDHGLDYIGPPWIKCEQTPWVTKSRVGNGGFTLLRVEAALKVLRNRHREQPTTLPIDMLLRNAKSLGPVIRLLEWIRDRFPNSELARRPIAELEKAQNPFEHGYGNDLFWSDKAIQFLPEFKIATVEQGLAFGFEADPRMCYEMNGGKLPFGCHAWYKFDRSFWEPYLLSPAEQTA